MSKPLKSFVHHGEIKGGKLILDSPRYWQGMVGMFNDAKVRIVLEKMRGTRTNRQNRYYWGVALELIAHHTGYLPEDVHEIMRARFLKKKRIWRGGEMAVLQSTSDLTSDEFTQYIEQVRQEAAEMEIEIPDPDKDWSIKEEFPEAYPDYKSLTERKK